MISTVCRKSCDLSEKDRRRPSGRALEGRGHDAFGKAFGLLGALGLEASSPEATVRR